MFANADKPDQVPKPGNYLRAWREDRQMTQADLATAVGTDKGVISLLESGKRRLNTTWLQKLSIALKCDPGDIVSTDPNSLPDDIRTSWLKATPEQRRYIATVAEEIVKFNE